MELVMKTKNLFLVLLAVAFLYSCSNPFYDEDGGRPRAKPHMYWVYNQDGKEITVDTVELWQYAKLKITIPDDLVPGDTIEAYMNLPQQTDTTYYFRRVVTSDNEHIFYGNTIRWRVEGKCTAFASFVTKGLKYSIEPVTVKVIRK
jgi:hypothetical protein